MPSLSELEASVFSDLADENKKVFTAQQVDDFIRGGMAELNRVAPPETVQNIPLVPSVYDYLTTISLPYEVELRDGSGNRLRLAQPEPNADAEGGYRFRRVPDGGQIELIRSLVDRVPFVEEPVDSGVFTSSVFLRVEGYGVRLLPDLPDDQTGLNSEEEFAVREYAKSEGFSLLTHDRALYQQWQGQTNNSDTSPVMLMNMAGAAKAAWDHKRGLIRTVRRYA